MAQVPDRALVDAEARVVVDEAAGDLRVREGRVAFGLALVALSGAALAAGGHGGG